MSKPRLRRLLRENHQDVYCLTAPHLQVVFAVHWIDVLRLGAPKAFEYYLRKAMRELEPKPPRWSEYLKSISERLGSHDH